MQMTQPHHNYIDLSDLNARYDQMAIRGLGGGSLGLGSSLGTAAGLSGYPWNAYSADTAALQISANIGLVASGYRLITVDGILGPATCGAVQAVLPGQLPSSCAGRGSTPPTRVAPATTPAAGAYYPWNQYSADTSTLQVQTNAALAAQGYELLATDGVLGPRTCGAVQAVAPGNVPSTCSGQSSTPPTRTSAAIAAAAAAAASAAASAAAAALPTIIPSTTTTIPGGTAIPVVVPVPGAPVVPTVVMPMPVPGVVPGVSPPPVEASVANGGLPWGLIAGGAAVVGLGAFLVTRKK